MDHDFPTPKPVAAAALAWTVLVGATVAAQEPPKDDVAASSLMPPPAAHAVDFHADVEPIFARACISCHGAKRQRSDYRLDLKASALAGGQIGGAIVVGHSAQSPLIHYVTGLDDKIRMPAKGEMLTDEEVGVLRRWIDDGAQWPDAEGTPADGALTAPLAGRLDHWAYLPITKPPLPSARAAWWIRTPVDAFLLAKLEEQGLGFAPPADRRTLLRRVTFDLTGLPPTPQECAAFEADASPGAWERVVDRLLASPRYGERWARRWMDLVHFAETHGNDQDRPRPDAWPYRDWLIAAFNDDLPYARFVEAQLAGDVLFPDDPAAIPALGFLAAGPWDESSQLNIVEETIDKQNARNLDRDDMVTTTMSTFVSATVQCARCHNHKFDPIAQKQYYQLQAVFAGVDRAVRPFDRDAATHARRQAILRRKLAIERAAADAPMLADAQRDSTLGRDVAEWERSLGGVGPPWSVLTFESVVSSGGATATLQPDGALLLSGELPEIDTCTLTARTDLRGITALRLDVLADESLPFQGPGRQDNGNLHLSEITVAAAAVGDGVADASGPSVLPVVPELVPIAAASADFDQEGWTSAMAIDGKLETAWGIWPQIGRSHHAVFEFAQPIGRGDAEEGDGSAERGTRLTITLAQLHGRHHLIGKLRLAVTTAPRPVRATKLPPPIAAILAVAPPQRTAAQTAELARHFLLARIDAELAALPPPQLVYAGTTDFTPENNFTPARGPRPIRLLARGDVAKPGELVEPGALACVAGMPGELAVADLDDEGERRAALARWITDRRNSLTWRSIVNRAWQHHFGRGLVDTPSDFGAMGGTPSHPELLDWLAAWFRDESAGAGGGGSLKQLDRLLVTSGAYLQSTRFDPRAAALDADDRLLWRRTRTRLDAESIRDAVLQIAGQLDLTMGGPSVKQFVESPGIHVTPNVDYDAFDVDRPENRRRSVYRFLFRTLPDPFMETMDCPDASQLAPTRASSVTPLQALSMLHDRFIVRMSEHIAERAAAAGPDPAAQSTALYEQILGRPPAPAELAALAAFLPRHGAASAARLLLNSNEFVFVE